ncbi:hypothetical protein [Methylobacterium sp. SI9]|uniref:hypothetical protein n=1 Tax=Methylobacterium guangdongense TaxID=3138811 RepID=UPI00313BD35B
MKPFAERRASTMRVMARIKDKIAHINGLTLAMSIRQDIQVGGRRSAAQYQYMLQSGDTAALDKWATTMAKTLAVFPGI